MRTALQCSSDRRKHADETVEIARPAVASQVATFSGFVTGISPCITRPESKR